MLLSDKYILCIDPSGSHMAYALLEIEAKEAVIVHTGMLWTKAAWTRGQRFNYMFQALEYLIEKHAPSPFRIVTEAFFSNPKLPMGQSVIPIVNGLMELIASRDERIVFEQVPPTVWRANLGIKSIKIDGKRDFKKPTAKYVEKCLGKVPEEIQSNVTLKQRATPHDLTDVLAIALSYCKREGINKVEMGQTAFLPLIINSEMNKLVNKV